MDIKSKYLIEKSNILNNFKCKPKENMTLNELRFFCMYVSRLNARNRELRTVDIKIKNFESLFNVKINTTEFNETLDRILKRSMYIYDVEHKKHKVVNLYSQFEWYDNGTNDIISITANYDIIPYLFELKSNYTTYKLENIAKLNSVSKIRLYEILTQYLKVGLIKFDIEELKDLMQSKRKDFKEFNRRVLTPAVNDINQYTDLQVSFEKITQRRKVIAIQFRIGKNKNAPIEQKEADIDIKSNNMTQYTFKSISSEPRTLKDLYRKYFTDEQYEQLSIMIKGHGISNTDVILKDALSALEEQMSQKKINSKIGYITNIVNNMIDDKLKPKSKKKIEPKKNQSYDIDEFERFAINDASLQKVYDEVFKDIMDAGFISADYETALKILKDNKEYKDLPKDKFNFIESQMESKRQAAEMMANI